MSPKKSGFAPVNGLEMYFEVYGSGEPLLLIHGGGSTIQSNWDNVIPLLAPNREVIAIETQAHGRTADIDRDFTFEQDADDVAALLRHLNIHKADIFGFSNGGQVAMQTAIRHPLVVNRLIIASAAYKREGFQTWFWPAMQSASIDNMPAPLKDAFLRVTPDYEQLVKMFNRDSTRMLNFKSWSDEAVNSITAPALVVSGDNDVVTIEHTVEIYRRIQGSRLAILPGGHGDYLGEISTGNNDTTLHRAFIGMVLAFLDAR